ncbi:hypothetical protein CJ483_00205 [Bacillus sp. PK3_68]|nr:hypothetical protein CJ483_00205 [Bacillus sp. PK3_68]
MDFLSTNHNPLLYVSVNRRRMERRWKEIGAMYAGKIALRLFSSLLKIEENVQPDPEADVISQ